MKLLDFSNCEKNIRVYGGMSGKKLGVVFNGENYLLKFPKNIRVAKINEDMSYSNTPVCEFIGSHIYDMLGIPVHETILGTRNDKIVVACKDFCNKSDKLYEFGEIKTTSDSPIVDSNGNETDGTGTDLNEILQTLETHELLKDMPEARKRFWDMFVVDALIGNGDRNNGNWGLLVHDNVTARSSKTGGYFF